MIIWGRILDLFAPQPPEHEYNQGGIINHPSVVWYEGTGRWFVYEQDGCGGGGDITIPGVVTRGSAWPDNYQEEVSRSLAIAGLHWERGSVWQRIDHGTPLKLGEISYHRPLAVDKDGNP